MKSIASFLASFLAAAVISAISSFPVLAQNTSQSGKPPLKAEELDQLVSPIALYPDNLLSQVLIASTYPLEVVQADRWVKDNKSLKGSALKAAADKQGWDDSIKSLTAVPDVLTMMSSQLDWTQKLGDAVLAQQPDVMDAVQRLRAKADANDKLKTTQQQKVSKSSQGGKQTIVIEPTVPETLYVPYYDPGVVYGAWPYAEYPPYYFPAPGYIASGVIATGIAFATGVAVGAWAGRGNWWGGSFNWGNNNININNDIDINKRNNWVHNPDHRHGVRYNNDAVRNKFAKGDGGNRENRMDFRGRDGQQVLKPDSRDLKPGDAKPGARDRPDTGKRPGGGDRPDAGKRPGGGHKQASRPGGDKAGQHRPDRDRPSSRPSGSRDGAMSHIDRGAHERASGNRGRASAGHMAGGPRPGGGIQRGGGPRPGGGIHAGGRPGGGAARGGGGRRR